MWMTGERNGNAYHARKLVCDFSVSLSLPRVIHNDGGQHFSS